MACSAIMSCPRPGCAASAATADKSAAGAAHQDQRQLRTAPHRSVHDSATQSWPQRLDDLIVAFSALLDCGLRATLIKSPRDRAPRFGMGCKAKTTAIAPLWRGFSTPQTAQSGDARPVRDLISVALGRLDTCMLSSQTIIASRPSCRPWRARQSEKTRSSFANRRRPSKNSIYKTINLLAGSVMYLLDSWCAGPTVDAHVQRIEVSA